MKFPGIAFILFFLLVFATPARPQSGVSTKGTDFWLAFMKNNDANPNESLDIFITSEQSASGTVSVPGQSWSQSFVLIANTTATISIPNSVAEILSSQQVEDKGIHIISDQAVSVYAINFETNTSDATKVLPTPALGVNYIIASYAGTTNHESELLIVATEDATEISVVPSAATTEGDAAGGAILVQLDAGECFQMKAAGNGDLSGTTIHATENSGSCRPFAVFSGTGCGFIPADCLFACDHIFEQNFPIEFWGTEYYTTPWVFELSPDWSVAAPNYTYRIMASENGTNIIIDGATAITLNAGQYQEYNYEVNAHCIIADRPIAVIQFMEGISCGGNGDPSMVILDDVTKKIDQVTFSTVESAEITSHYLNLIIDTDALGTISFDGTPVAASQFQSFNTCNGQLWCGFEITEGSHTLVCPSGVTGYVYGNGNSESYAYSVGSHYDVPPIPIEDAFCTNNAVVLEMSQTYFNPRWYNTSDLENILSSDYQFNISPPIENGIYLGICSESVSGCEREFYFSVESPDPIPLTLESSNTTICEHQQVMLNAMTEPVGATYLYSWSPTEGLDDPTSATPNATPDHNITYTVVVSTLNGCATATASTTFTINPGNIALYQVVEDEILICAGDAGPLQINTEEEIWSDNFDPSISWGDWEDIVGGVESTVCGSVAGNALYFNGVYPREAITNPMDVGVGGTIYFSLKIANGIAPCDNAEPGDNVILSYSVSNGPWIDIQIFYEASLPEFVNISVPIPVAAQSASTRFKWRQGGAFLPNQDNWILDELYIGTVATNSYNYSWSPAADLDVTNATLVNASPNTSTTYTVQMTDPSTGCVYRDSVFVNVGEPFTLNLSADTSICDVQGVQIHAFPDIPGNFEFEWTPNTNVSGFYGPEPVVMPAVTTTYHVEVTSEQGCMEEGDIEVVLSALLDLTLSATDDQLCEGETTTLSAALAGNPSGVSYEWTPALDLSDANAANTDADPTTNVDYICTVTHDASGCQLTEEIQIEVTPTFTIAITPDEITSCVIEGQQITANPSYNLPLDWQWSPASAVTMATNATTSVASDLSVELTLTATSAAGCEATDSIQLNLIVETIDLGPDTGFCEVGNISLNTGWPEDYDILWSNNAITSSILVSTSGTYSVSAVSPDGCVSQDEIVVTAYDYPVVDFGPDTILCEGNYLELIAGLPSDMFNYNWNNNTHEATLSPVTTGLYTVTVDNGYCFSSDEINIIYRPLPLNPFTHSEIEYCFGYSQSGLLLDAQNSGSSYLWNDNSTDSVLKVYDGGDYSVIITTEHDCVSLFDITIKQNCPVALYVPNSFTPDNDGVNDVWFVYGQNIVNFNLKLYNRWGEVFFENNDMNIPWLGQRRDGDHYMEPGVYPYHITFQSVDDNGVLSEEKVVDGFVTMIR